MSPDISGYTTGSAMVSIGLHLDGVQGLLNLSTPLAVYAQPTFSSQQYTLQQGSGTIVIQVRLGVGGGGGGGGGRGRGRDSLDHTI